MFKACVLIMMLLTPNAVLATEESLDLAFLEWLGETAEMEEMGIDIDKLLQQQEQDAEQESEELSQ